MRWVGAAACGCYTVLLRHRAMLCIAMRAAVCCTVTASTCRARHILRRTSWGRLRAFPRMSVAAPGACRPRTARATTRASSAADAGRCRLRCAQAAHRLPGRWPQGRHATACAQGTPGAGDADERSFGGAARREGAERRQGRRCGGAERRSGARRPAGWHGARSRVSARYARQAPTAVTPKLRNSAGSGSRRSRCLVFRTVRASGMPPSSWRI
jgi:hypothetical protein